MNEIVQASKGSALASNQSLLEWRDIPQPCLEQPHHDAVHSRDPYGAVSLNTKRHYATRNYVLWSELPCRKSRQ